MILSRPSCTYLPQFQSASRSRSAKPNILLTAATLHCLSIHTTCTHSIAGSMVANIPYPPLILPLLYVTEII